MSEHNELKMEPGLPPEKKEKKKEEPGEKKPNNAGFIIGLICICLVAAAVTMFVKGGGFGGDSGVTVEAVPAETSELSSEDEGFTMTIPTENMTSAEQEQAEKTDKYIAKSYKELTDGYVFNARGLTFKDSEGKYVVCNMNQIAEIMGEPEESKEWTYTGATGQYPVTSYYYNLKSEKEPTLQFVFYNNGLMEVIVMEGIQFDNRTQLLKKFGLELTDESQIAVDEDFEYRVYNCGIQDFWAYALEKDDNGKWRAYCYLRYFEL